VRTALDQNRPVSLLLPLHSRCLAGSDSRISVPGWRTHYTPGRGLRVRARGLPAADSAKPGKCAQISVLYIGTGVDAGTLDHIFEPFFISKEVAKATAPGLAIVYGLVEQHRFCDRIKRFRSGFRLKIPLSSGVADRQAEAYGELWEVRHDVRNPHITHYRNDNRYSGQSAVVLDRAFSGARE
jgi:hypothetical protein